MIYEHYYDPIAHAIVHDFFEDQYDEVFDLVKQLDPYLEDGYVTHDIYKKNSEVFDVINKKNKNFWLNKCSDNPISKRLNELVLSRIWSNQFRKMYLENKDSLFQYYHRSNVGNILISKYSDGGFYEWHIDKTRSLTCSIVMFDGTIDGGDFCLKANSGEVKRYSLETNSAIFFPSECTHKVTEVKSNTPRYSIQYFSEFLT
jgi:hypothetical protein